MPVATELRGVVGEHVAAVNAFDLDRIVATFTPDAYVNDNRREIWGIDAIRAFMAKEFVGDHVTMEVREVLESDDPATINAKAEALQSAFHAVSESMYQRAQEQAAATGADGTAPNGDSAGNGAGAEDVVDAEVVDEGK